MTNEEKMLSEDKAKLAHAEREMNSLQSKKAIIEGNMEKNLATKDELNSVQSVIDKTQTEIDHYTEKINED